MTNKTYDFNQMAPVKIWEAVASDDALRWQIATNMKEHGGSFVQALGELLFQADYLNRLTIAEAFFGHICKYAPNKWPEKKP